MMTAADIRLIHAIADRAASLYQRLGHLSDADVRFARAGIAHEIMTVHSRIVPLRLSAFLDADDANFAHDVGGIHRHLHDGDAPCLKDCFLPRFAGH